MSEDKEKKIIIEHVSSWEDAEEVLLPPEEGEGLAEGEIKVVKEVSIKEEVPEEHEIPLPGPEEHMVEVDIYRVAERRDKKTDEEEIIARETIEKEAPELLKYENAVKKAIKKKMVRELITMFFETPDLVQAVDRGEMKLEDAWREFLKRKTIINSPDFKKKAPGFVVLFFERTKLPIVNWGKMDVDGFEATIVTVLDQDTGALVPVIAPSDPLLVPPKVEVVKLRNLDGKYVPVMVPKPWYEKHKFLFERKTEEVEEKVEEARKKISEIEVPKEIKERARKIKVDVSKLIEATRRLRDIIVEAMKALEGRVTSTDFAKAYILLLRIRSEVLGLLSIIKAGDIEDVIRALEERRGEIPEEVVDDMWKIVCQIYRQAIGRDPHPVYKKLLRKILSPLLTREEMYLLADYLAKKLISLTLAGPKIIEMTRKVLASFVWGKLAECLANIANMQEFIRQGNALGTIQCLYSILNIVERCIDVMEEQLGRLLQYVRRYLATEKK